MSVPPAVVELVVRLEKEGYETWTVGGAVRDALRGCPGTAEDWDLATRATPREVQGLFGRTVPLGVEYGTVGVFGSDGVLYEVTTFRRDVITYGRRAVVAFAGTLDEDLARRDFTVNAMAWHPIRQELRDPHGGYRDLRAGRLRAVGCARLRFREDYLRLLRGLRFAGVLELSIEDSTWEAMVDAVPGLTCLSMERVREELLRVLGAPRASPALRLYSTSGALARLLPGFHPLEQAALDTVDTIRAHRPLLRMAALLLLGLGSRSAASTTVDLLERLRFSNQEVERVRRAMLGGTNPVPSLGAAPERRRWAAGVGARGIRDIARIWLAASRAQRGSGDELLFGVIRALRRDLREGVPLSVDKLALGGRDLVSRGWRPGPLIGEVLRHLLQRVWEDPALNDRQLLLHEADQWRLVRQGSTGEQTNG